MARVDITVPMEEKLDDKIKEQLDYGDSRAAWIREAIRMRLREEGVEVATDGSGVSHAD